jgi:hypothetical protein
MTLIRMKIVENTSAPAQTNRFDDALTSASVSFEDGDFCPIAWVDLREMLNDEWVIGGFAMSEDEICAAVAGH